MLPADLPHDYDLPENDLLEAVEVTMTRVLTKALRHKITATCRS